MLSSLDLRVLNEIRRSRQHLLIQHLIEISNDGILDSLKRALGNITNSSTKFIFSRLLESYQVEDALSLSISTFISSSNISFKAQNYLSLYDEFIHSDLDLIDSSLKSRGLYLNVLRILNRLKTGTSTAEWTRRGQIFYYVSLPSPLEEEIKALLDSKELTSYYPKQIPCDLEVKSESTSLKESFNVTLLKVPNIGDIKTDVAILTLPEWIKVKLEGINQ